MTKPTILKGLRKPHFVQMFWQCYKNLDKYPPFFYVTKWFQIFVAFSKYLNFKILFYASFSSLFRLTALTEKNIEKLLEPTTSNQQLMAKKLHNHDENDDGRKCALLNEGS